MKPQGPKLSLVVDDDEGVRGYVKSILEREHILTFEAGDGFEALRFLKTFGGVVDLIISDVRMVGGDGITFVCAAREVFPTLPVVLLSAYGEPGTPRLRTTDFEFLPKPFSPARLLHAIAEAYKKAESKAATAVA